MHSILVSSLTPSIMFLLRRPLQKFDADTFENGVFLGPIAHLTFKGPCTTKAVRGFAILNFRDEEISIYPLVEAIVV